MNLLEQLRNILADPGILPVTPEESVYASEIIARTKTRLTGTYSDNSIRAAISTLAADATSPVAKVDQGYGYYRRPLAQQAGPSPEAPTSSVNNNSKGGGAEQAESLGGRDVQLEEKFRALYLRYARLGNRFPLKIEHVAAARQAAGVNKWKFPDVVVLDWDAGEATDEGFSLNRAVLEVKRSLGEQPFRLSSVELKVELSLASFREFFFQCVSNSMWAHSANLAVAMPVSDSLLVSELRRLGASYGIAVHSYGLSRDALAALPTATEIGRMQEADFEKLAAGVTVATLSSGSQRGVLDWDHIRDMMAQSQEFNDIFDWIARCLRDTRAYTFENYLSLARIERETRG